jgi:hypothetical protein
MKKVKRSLLTEASPSTSSYQVGDGDKTKFRFQSLWLDYQDLDKVGFLFRACLDLVEGLF